MKVFIPLLLGVTLVVFALFSVTNYVAGANTSALSLSSLLVVNNLEMFIVAGLVVAISVLLFMAFKK